MQAAAASVKDAEACEAKHLRNFGTSGSLRPVASACQHTCAVTPAGEGESSTRDRLIQGTCDDAG